MTAYAYDVLGITLGLTGAVAATVACFWPRTASATEPAPSVSALPDARAYLPCHTTTCGHMTTPHDRTAAGLVCRGCGNTTLEVTP